jgi:carbamoyltransferase
MFGSSHGPYLQLIRQKNGLRRLALTGGVALNCTANGRLTRCGAFDEVFVQPAAGDDGSALGAAAFRAALHREVRNARIRVPFLGPTYSRSLMAQALDEFKDEVKSTDFSNLFEASEQAARLIAAGHVIAWYRGRMEFGPRALGHRCILADPANPEMRTRINAIVKMREAFRPFAPAVTVREAPRWFDVAVGTELPYMISTVDVREEYRRELPAITHLDGSARLQTVSPEDNQSFHTLLEAVGKKTGREMVLNTSFNVRGQPMVNTPRQALETFLGSGIDFLFLEDSLIQRRSGLSCSVRCSYKVVVQQQLDRLRHV